MDPDYASPPPSWEPETKIALSMSDVIGICDELMESALQNSTGLCVTREEAALAAEVKAEVVLYTLTTHTEQDLSGGFYAHRVTVHFANLRTTQRLLESLLNILKLHRRLYHSGESR